MNTLERFMLVHCLRYFSPNVKTLVIKKMSLYSFKLELWVSLDLHRQTSQHGFLWSFCFSCYPYIRQCCHLVAKLISAIKIKAHKRDGKICLGFRSVCGYCADDEIHIKHTVVRKP